MVIVHVDGIGLLLAAVNDDFALLRLLLWAFALIKLRLRRLLLHTHFAIVIATRTFRVYRQTITLIQDNIGLFGTGYRLLLLLRIRRLLNLAMTKLSRIGIASIIKHL